MSKIKLINSDTLKEYKIVEQNVSEEYLKLQKEADERILESRRENAKACIKANEYIANASIYMDGFLNKIDNIERFKEPNIDDELILNEEYISNTLNSYSYLLDSGLINEATEINNKKLTLKKK